MKFHSLLTLGLGAALVLGTSSMVLAQTASDTVQVAAMNMDKAKTGKTTESQKKKGSKAAAKTTNKTPEKNAKAVEKPRSIFAVLFKSSKSAEPAAGQRRPAAKAQRNDAAVQPVALRQPVDAIVATGNNGELRSESAQRSQDPVLSSLFGGKKQPVQSRLLPETQALDAALAARGARRQFKVRADFEPQQVRFSGYQRGTIVIDTSSRYLYLVESGSTARRYAIAVGRDGLQFKGKATVGDKQEWPRWIPTLDMQKREPKKYGQYKDGMPGGPNNPLGARAIYLYQGNKDTHIRIHGTNQPQTIGTNSSNGCFRMVNEHVQDLYGRVGVGTAVIVM